MRISDWSSDVLFRSDVRAHCVDRSGIDPDRQRLEALDEGRENPARLAHDLDLPGLRPSLERFLPQHAQLHLREAIADTAMDAEAERQVMTRIGTVDDEPVGVLDLVAVTVARDVPHHDLIALLDL